jgi:GNAT superfamily N-acetyltransferase
LTVSVSEVPLEAVLPLRRAVLRSHRPGLPVVDQEDSVPGTFHLAVVDDGGGGAVVAVATLTPEPCPVRPTAPPAMAVRLRGMAVRPDRQGEGLGRLLLDAAVARLRADGVALLWANARDTALGFYQRLGLEAVGDSFLAQDLPHTVVVMAL